METGPDRVTVSADGVDAVMERNAAGYHLRFRASDGGRSLCAAEPVLTLDGRTAPLAYGSSASRPADLYASVEGDGFTLSTCITPAADTPLFDVVNRLTAKRKVFLTRFQYGFRFAPEPAASDFAWIPNLCEKDRDVCADHAFRSPCVIVRRCGTQAALVPSLDPERNQGPLRRTLSLRRAGGSASFSFSLEDCAPHGHVYYAPTGSATLLKEGESVDLCFTLLFDLKADGSAHGTVLRFLWKRYGEPVFSGTLEPQVLPFGRYARASYRSTLESYGLWRDFPIDGKECGGTCARIMRPSLDRGSLPLPGDITPAIAFHYLTTRTLRLRDKAAMLRWNGRGILPHVWNGIFLNQVRTSFGMAYWGRQWGDAALLERARRMRNLALLAPSSCGIFPAVFTADARSPHWIPGTRIWRYTRSYHTPDAAWTGWWMLRTHGILGEDPALLHRCVELGRFFRRIQLPSGAIPTWVGISRSGRPRPEAALRESASSAAAGMFLAALAQATGEEACLAAARAVADFLLREILPGCRWQDAEVYYSCGPKRPGWRDPRTGIPPQGSLCLGWAAELFLSLASATGEDRYRAGGRTIVDLLLLHQQVWNPPFIGFHAFGGFGVMNTDSEWSDARQAQFATLLMGWYALTGEPELFQRGVAALRASFTLMHLEEHGRLAPGNMAGVGGADMGALPENYGHAGRDAKIPGYIMPDWGGGSAAGSAALARALYGDLYLDAPRGRAFGVNGCRVLSQRFRPASAALTTERLQASAPLLLHAAGAAADLVVTVDGRTYGPFHATEWERGVPMKEDS